MFIGGDEEFVRRHACSDVTPRKIMLLIIVPKQYIRKPEAQITDDAYCHLDLHM